MNRNKIPLQTGPFFQSKWKGKKSRTLTHHCPSYKLKMFLTNS